MAETWRYRGQEIGGGQLAFLRFMGAHPTSSRWKLSRQLCEALGWRQTNGALRDVVCRGLRLMLERAGELELPPGPEGTPPSDPRAMPDGASAAGGGPDRHHAFETPARLRGKHFDPAKGDAAGYFHACGHAESQRLRACATVNSSNRIHT